VQTIPAAHTHRSRAGRVSRPQAARSAAMAAKIT
jgi:hypothetical protein